MNARVLRSPVPFVLSLAVASIGTLAGAAAAAPSPGVLVIAEGARCRVLMTKVSYDDPGADDAEFLELYVERWSSSPALGADSGISPTPDGAVGAAVLTLGDCGLESLELVSGGGGACDTYRTIPLSAIPVPDDGYVTFCGTDSTLAGTPCDVMAAGRSALRNGWLQNGPSDGLRFRARDGSSALELAYEGAVGCFGPSARQLANETGQMPGTPEPADDVNTFCGDAFVALPLVDAPLRHEAVCPRMVTSAALTDAGSSASEDAASARVVGPGPDASTWTPERAPTPRPKSPTSVYAGLGIDAGLVAIPKTPSVPPKPPGCSMTRTTSAGYGPLVTVLAVLLVFTRRIRRI
jgi:hypothetical protein